MVEIPSEFWWGSSLGSTHGEGAAPGSDWARWESLGRAPHSGTGNGFARNYREDFQAVSEHGLRHLRLTLDWARLEPTEGQHDQQAIEHYRTMLTEARSVGIEPWICLHDIALPGWFSDDTGGFLDDRALGMYWPRHVEFIGETFGDLAAGWMPVNQPVAYSVGAFLRGNNPPGRTSMKDLLDGLRAMLLATFDAARRLRSGSIPRATAMNLCPLIARAGLSDDPAATASARDWADVIDHMMWRSWMSIINSGLLTLPGRADEDVAWAADVFDVVGFSSGAVSTVDEHSVIASASTDRLRAAPDDVDWNETPQADGLDQILERLADGLGPRRFLISDFGIRTPLNDRHGDDRRCREMERAADIVDRHVADGVDVGGIFWANAVDGYAWHAGNSLESGLFDRQRRPRRSADLARELASG